MSIDTVPNEILVAIIENVEWDKDTCSCLSEVSNRFRKLLQAYSQSITARVGETQHATAASVYPQPVKYDTLGELQWSWLTKIIHREYVIRSILVTICECSFCPCPASAQKTLLWIPLIEAALYINYEITDIPCYEDKTKHILSLPLVSLALLFTMLQRALMAAQKQSPEMLDLKKLGDIKHNEKCLCFEECSLLHGPEFMFGMLLGKEVRYFPSTEPMTEDKRAIAHAIINDEHDIMDEKEQGNNETGARPVRTLLSRLREALCIKGDCAQSDASRMAWDIVQHDSVMKNDCGVSGFVLRT